MKKGLFTVVYKKKKINGLFFMKKKYLASHSWTFKKITKY